MVRSNGSRIVIQKHPKADEHARALGLSFARADGELNGQDALVYGVSPKDAMAACQLLQEAGHTCRVE